MMAKKDKKSKTNWYELVSFFDGAAKKAVELGEHNVIVQGTINELEYANCQASLMRVIESIKKGNTSEAIDTLTSIVNNHSPILAVCTVPCEAVSNEQGEALRRLLSANLRLPTLVLTNNVQLVKLKPITEARAKDVMLKEGTILEDQKKIEGKVNVTTIDEKKKISEEKGEQRKAVREKDRSGHENNL